MKISIIIPVYNVEKYLNECIDSLLKQSYTDFELLLIDDGSKDKSGEICDYYATIDNRVCAFHKENGGPVSACNIGLENATGEYIAFIDADDFVDKDYLQSMADVLKPNTDIVFTNFIRYINDNSLNNYKINKLPEGEHSINYSFLDDVIYSHEEKLAVVRWGKLIRASIAKEAAKYCTDKVFIGEDYQYYVALMLNSKFIVVLDDYKYYYRCNPTSQLNSYRVKYWERSLILFETIDKIPGVENLKKYDKGMSSVFICNVCYCIINEYNYNKLTKQYFKELLNCPRTQSSLKYVKANDFSGIIKYIVKALKKKSYLGVKFAFFLRKIYRIVKRKSDY